MTRDFINKSKKKKELLHSPIGYPFGKEKMWHTAWVVVVACVVRFVCLFSCDEGICLWRAQRSAQRERACCLFLL